LSPFSGGFKFKKILYTKNKSYHLKIQKMKKIMTQTTPKLRTTDVVDIVGWIVLVSILISSIVSNVF